MVLADTNIWIDFLRGKDQNLGQILWRGDVVTHWIVIGELATGTLPDRPQMLADLRSMEQVPPATERESLALIENQKLFGKGLGWSDIQLLAACLIHHVPLWTHDKRLADQAKRLGCAWKPAGPVSDVG
jgi:predicted nucleic acid-binding protein